LEVVPLLETSPGLQALTVLEELQRRYPDRFSNGRLWTLPRRVKAWRAQHGPAKEVMFRQTHAAGQWGLSDFTELKGVVITGAGEVLGHRLDHFRRAYRGWSYARVVLGGERFPARAEGLARERLGGAPAEHRTDRLSAADRNLSRDDQADLTARYQARCAP
jgi:hypothetical protein